MPATDAQGPAARLTEMLAAEAALIRAANFRALPGGDTEKLALMRRLASEHASAPAAELARLRTQAEINQRLLAAARDGLRAARQRLVQIRGGGGPLTIYDADGQGRILGAPHPPGSARARRV